MFNKLKNLFSRSVKVWGLYEYKNTSYFSQLAGFEYTILVTDVYNDTVYFMTVTQQNGFLFEVKADQVMSKWQFNKTFRRKR